MSLNGSLADFSVEHVLRLLELSAQTGTLRLRIDGRSSTVEVTAGTPTSARHDRERGVAALGAILSLRSGTFAFRPGATRAADLAGSLAELLERSRTVAGELATIRADIADDRVRFTLSERATSGGAFTIASDELRVLLTVDGRRDVAAIAAHCGYGRLETLRHLHRLLREGLVAKAAPGEAAVAVTTSEPVRKPRRRPKASIVAAAPEPEPAEPLAATPAMEPPPSVEEVSRELDVRLAALLEAQPPDAAPAAEERAAVPEERPAAAASEPLVVVTPTAEPAAVEGAGRTVKFELHYLPAGVAPPVLEIERPATPAPKRRSLFALFGTWRRAREPHAEAAPLDVPTPAQLAALANELYLEYRRLAEAQRELAGRGGATFAEGIAARLQRLYLAHPIGRRLPLRDDLIDVVALRGDDVAPIAVLPYLAALVQQLRADAAAAWGRDEAERVYREIVARTFGVAPTVGPTEILRRSAAPLRARLVVRSGGSGSFDLGPRTYVIGRSSSCDVVLPDPSVSGRHAKLTPGLDGFRIADLGSTNGTLVNGQPLTGELPLRGGEVLRLGDALLLYERLADEPGR